MSGRQARFEPTSLLPFLDSLNCRGKWFVAFSGGADSTALLLSLYDLRDQLGGELCALHVNHGLHPSAGAWEAHCQRLCAELAIPCFTERISPSLDTGEGTEAELRRLRYGALTAYLGETDVLLTAHHLEDQAETVLLNLTRGSGPEGLAGMPGVRPLNPGRLARPLLSTSKSALLSYLIRKGASWIEDSGNRDERFDRNFIRQRLMPLLRSRWPAMDSSLVRSASHSEEAASLLSDYATGWLDKALSSSRVLDVRPFQGEKTALLKLAIRHWLRREGADPIPGTRLEELCRQLKAAGTDSSVSLNWAAWRVDLFHDQLWLSPRRSLQPCPQRDWNGSQVLDLGPSVGTLSLQGGIGHQLPPGTGAQARSGGETIVMHVSGQHRRVKELLRDAGVPPWLRGSIPLLKCEGRTLAVGDLAIGHELASWLDGHRLKLVWAPREPQLKLARSRCLESRLATRERLG
jgi:tRNA(Ile)-lysidine synthase